MNLALLTERLVAYRLQAAHRSRPFHAHLVGHVSHRVHRTEPNDVLNVDVVANQCLRIVVDVDDAHQSVAPLSEEIQEGGVLPEGIIRISG